MTSEYLNNKVFESNIDKFKQSKKAKMRYEFIIEDLTESQNNVMLLQQKKFEYKEIVNQYHDSQSKLAIAFLTLAENIIRYRKFHYVDIDDAIQEFAMICFEKIDRFDPDKGKAFNYMTTCILNHYRQLYRTARNYNEFKKKFHGHLQFKTEQLPYNKIKSVAIARDKYSRL